MAEPGADVEQDGEQDDHAHAQPACALPTCSVSDIHLGTLLQVLCASLAQIPHQRLCGTAPNDSL